MNNFHIISLDEALASFNRRPGILIGPDATCIPETLRRIIATSFGNVEGCGNVTRENYRSVFDDLEQKSPLDARQVRDAYRAALGKLAPSLDLPHLATAGWSACISLTEDLLFEGTLQTFLDQKPTLVTATVIDNPFTNPPDRTIPIYKLMGNFHTPDDERTVVLSEAQLLLKQQTWPQMLRTAPDFLREAPLFITGTTTVLPLLRVVLGALLAMPKPNLSRVLFLKDDPSLNDPTIRTLCNQRPVDLIDASLRDICTAISQLRTRARSVPVSGASSVEAGLAKVVGKHEAAISLVPTGNIEQIVVDRELPKLVDGLFRPATVDWRPFQAKLDLRRSVTDKLNGAILDSLSSPNAGPKALVVHGEAGIGKTLLLKRSAIELASQGVIVLWARRALGGNFIKTYRDLARGLADHIRDNSKASSQYVVFCDDPWALRIDATELLACFEHFPAKLTIVFAVRNTDYFAGDVANLTSSGHCPEIEVPYAVDDREIVEIQKLLLKIRAVRDREEAENEIKRLGTRNTRDILCSLWYLIPETKSQIIDSLRDEYCRLGGAGDSISAIAGGLSATSIAHKAYEYVTVMSNLGLGLPIEVLVRALGVNYEDWLDMTVDGRPLWGLLYDEADPDRNTVQFWTRNEIVTSVLLDLVNGGVGHAGEVRVLKELLAACRAGSTIYRDFALDILVRARSKLAKILTYPQGLELYEIAQAALPHADRVLEHHKGIWMHNAGHDYKRAYEQFEAALACEQYPGAERDAATEHIHTSMAATLVQMIKLGSQDRNTGHELVRQHLKQASSPTFFNLHTSHVAANLLFELSQQGEGPADEVSLAAMAEAMNEIERAKQTIGAHVRGYSRHEKTLGMMADLLRKIIGSIPDIDVIKRIARERFELTGSQIGYEVAARRMLVEASETGKGKAYFEVQQYLDECANQLSQQGVELEAELVAIRIDLVVRWKIQAQKAVKWDEFLRDLEYVLSKSSQRDNVMKLFYYAVALFQCGKFTDANARFAGLRRLHVSQASMSPREVRCYYLGEGGPAKRFQGKVEKQQQNWYFDVSELGTTIPSRPPSGISGNGGVAHAFIGFALNGPIAVFTKPGESDILLS